MWAREPDACIEISAPLLPGLLTSLAMVLHVQNEDSITCLKGCCEDEMNSNSCESKENGASLHWAPSQQRSLL